MFVFEKRLVPVLYDDVLHICTGVKPAGPALACGCMQMELNGQYYGINVVILMVMNK